RLVRMRPRLLAVIEQAMPALEEAARTTPATVGNLPPDQADDTDEKEEAEGEAAPIVPADHGDIAATRDQTRLKARGVDAVQDDGAQGDQPTANQQLLAV